MLGLRFEILLFPSLHCFVFLSFLQIGTCLQRFLIPHLEQSNLWLWEKNEVFSKNQHTFLFSPSSQLLVRISINLQADQRSSIWVDPQRQRHRRPRVNNQWTVRTKDFFSILFFERISRLRRCEQLKSRHSGGNTWPRSRDLRRDLLHRYESDRKWFIRCCVSS